MLESRPDDPRLRFGLALEHLKEGSLEEGATELRKYLELTDDEGNAWGRLGAALAELGRTDEAREAYGHGIAAAARHGHPTMAEEFRQALEELEA
jgi:Flp pilus assembly protein TadD